MCDCTCEGFWRGFAKVLLIIVNIIFLLAGALMLALGIALVVAPDKVLSTFSTGDLNTDQFTTSFGDTSDWIIKGVGIFMIILGGVVMIVSLLGFFGACCENTCLLVTYAVILIIVVLAEVALIIFGALYPTVLTNSVSSTTYNDLKGEFQRDFQINSTGYLDYSSLTDFGRGMAVVQPFDQCCGVYNSTDYATFSWTPASCSSGSVCPFTPVPSPKVPLSCCIPKDQSTQPQTVNDYVNYQLCMTNPTNSTAYMTGCVQSIQNTGESIIKQYGKIAIGIAAGIAGLEIILIILAFVLCCTHADGKYV